VNPKSALKKLIDELDEKVARKILKDWNDIVESYKKTAMIHFDGSSKPNPGMMRIGAVIECCGEKKRISKTVGLGTNNIAEYLALIEALKIARKMGAKAVEVYGDSTIVVEQVNGRWRTKSEKLKELKREVLELLGKFKRWKVEWIPEKENEEAHRLATENEEV
jgi:ribonuclease HI